MSYVKLLHGIHNFNFYLPEPVVLLILKRGYSNRVGLTCVDPKI